MPRKLHALWEIMKLFAHGRFALKLYAHCWRANKFPACAKPKQEKTGTHAGKYVQLRSAAAAAAHSCIKTNTSPNEIMRDG